MQLAVPGRMRGRVMGHIGTVTRGIGPFAETQSGIVAGAIGAPLAVVSAAAALVIAAGTMSRVPALWGFSRDEAASQDRWPSLDSDAVETPRRDGASIRGC